MPCPRYIEPMSVGLAPFRHYLKHLQYLAYRSSLDADNTTTYLRTVHRIISRIAAPSSSHQQRFRDCITKSRLPTRRICAQQCPSAQGCSNDTIGNNSRPALHHQLRAASRQGGIRLEKAQQDELILPRSHHRLLRKWTVLKPG